MLTTLSHYLRSCRAFAPQRKPNNSCLGLSSAMLSLSGTRFSRYGNARARQSVAFRGFACPRAVQRPVAAAAAAPARAAVVLPEAVGPACQTLLNHFVDDRSFQEQFAERTATRLDQAQSALTALHELGFEGAQFAGGLAAGTWMPGTAVVIAVPVPDYDVAEHTSHLEKLKQQLEGSAFAHVEIHNAVLSCSYNFLSGWVVLIVGSSEPVDVLQLLDPTLSTEQRAVLSCSTILASTAFLQDRPALYRTAALVVKEWARESDDLSWAYSSGYNDVHAHNCNHNRSFDYLLDLLVLEAYTDYLASATADTLSHAKRMDAPAALDAVLLGFLKLVSNLSEGNRYYWDWRYHNGVVDHVTDSTALAAALRPEGFEDHPILLDPADPTNNMAAALDAEQLAEFIAAAKAALQACAATAETQAALSAQAEAAALLAQREKPVVLDPEQHQAAVRLHQSILEDGNVWEWVVDPKPISSWLPSASGAGDFETIDEFEDEFVHGFEVEMLARTLGSAVNGFNPGLGIELRLNPECNPFMRVLEALQVPLPVTLLKGSSIEVIRSNSQDSLDEGGFASKSEIVLDHDISGVLGTESGLVWEPSRLQWYHLELCELGGGYQDDLRTLKEQEEAGCELKLVLQLSFGKRGSSAKAAE